MINALMLGRHGVVDKPPSSYEYTIGQLNLADSHVAADGEFALDLDDEIEIHLINASGTGQFLLQFSDDNAATWKTQSGQWSLDHNTERNTSGSGPFNGLVLTGGSTPANRDSFYIVSGLRAAGSLSRPFTGWVEDFDALQSGYLDAMGPITNVRVTGVTTATGGTLLIVGKRYKSRRFEELTFTGAAPSPHEFDVSGMDKAWMVYAVCDVSGTQNLAARVSDTFGTPITDAEYSISMMKRTTSQIAFDNIYMQFGWNIGTMYGLGRYFGFSSAARTLYQNVNIYSSVVQSFAGTGPQSVNEGLEVSSVAGAQFDTGYFALFSYGGSSRSVDIQTLSGATSVTFDVTGMNEASISSENLTRSAVESVLVECSTDGGVSFTNTGEWVCFAEISGLSVPDKASNGGYVAGGLTTRAHTAVHITGLTEGNYPVVMGQYGWTTAAVIACSRWNDTAAVTHIRLVIGGGATMSGDIECIATAV